MENLAEKNSFRGGAKMKVATRSAHVNGTLPKKSSSQAHSQASEKTRKRSALARIPQALNVPEPEQPGFLKFLPRNAAKIQQTQDLLGHC
jgi:hypothetical protein